MEARERVRHLRRFIKKARIDSVIRFGGWIVEHGYNPLIPIRNLHWGAPIPRVNPAPAPKIS
jgi:hypothetical protein